MATAALKGVSDFVYEWEGKDRGGKQVRGELRAAGENQVKASLRRQGVLATKIKKRRMRSGKSIKPKDIAIFTRQLATMMKAGVPLLQSFDIVGRGNPNASVTKLLNDVRTDVETGTSLSAAFRKYPLYFNALYCNLVEAGEAAGILEALLDRLAVYMEKTEAIKSKIKSADCVSRLPVGSSANTRAGCITSARAIATRCCCPPDKSLARWCPQGVKPTLSIRSSARWRMFASGLPRMASSGSMTFSTAVKAGSRL